MPSPQLLQQGQGYKVDHFNATEKRKAQEESKGSTNVGDGVDEGDGGRLDHTDGDHLLKANVDDSQTVF